MRSSRLLALAGRELKQLGRSPADVLLQPAWLAAAVARPFTSGAGSYQGAPWRQQQLVDGRGRAFSLAAPALPPAAASAAAAAQLLPCRGFAADGRPAALRRLRRATARSAVGVGARGGGREAALAREAAGGGELEAGPAHDVVVHEGPANSLQVASVVDHPALIVTRPIEWCAARAWFGL